MSVNLDEPSIAGADVVGLFQAYDKEHGHSGEREGWARAVVTKIERDLTAPGANVDHRPQDNIPQDEWAVYQWYLEQTKPERWKALVDASKASDPIKSPAHPDEANSTITKPNVDVVDPNIKPFAGRGGGPGSVAVSTDAILHFANALNIVAPLDGKGGMLTPVIESLERMNPRPGAFARAELLRQDLVGESGSPNLLDETRAVLVAIQAVLASVQTGMRALAKDYDSTEELNSLSVAKFGDVMRESDARINVLGTQTTKDKDLTGD